MFHEINDVKQEPGAGRRRWFEADGLDLIVWLEGSPEERVTGFQLCYDAGRRPRALTWRAETGFAHSVVDTGDATPLRNEAPVLELANDVPWATIAQRFAEHSGSLDPWLARLIQQKLATGRV